MPTKDPEKLRAKRARWYQKHAEEHKARIRNRYRDDAEYNAQQKVRARIRKLTLDDKLARHTAQAIKRGQQRMPRSWASAGIPYTPVDLVAHLKTTMPDGYTWADFMAGELHIDHIIPRSLYDLNDPEQVRLCWQLFNLRLLPREENQRKRARIDFA